LSRAGSQSPEAHVRRTSRDRASRARGHFMAVMGTAIVLGLLAERVLDPGIGVAAGLLGFYLGAWLWDLTGWSMGPLPAGLPIVPTAVGAFAVCGFLKLI